MGARHVTRAGFDVEAFLSASGPGRTLLQCRKGQVIFAQGDVADAVYFVRTGRIKLGVVSARGREGVIAVVGPGGFVGEQCLSGANWRQATAVALSDGTMVCIRRDEMRHLLQAPPFAEHFMRYLLERNCRMEDDLVDQLFNSSEQRLARVLLLLADFSAGSGTGLISPRISQETLAEMIGTTRSRVSFFMNRFRKRGFVDYGHALEVRRSLADVLVPD
jgi:CRP-like cAMP-binding protein